MFAKRTSVIVTALLPLFLGCATNPPDPAMAVSLISTSLRGKYSCYPIPSAYFVPGTIIRVKRDPDNPNLPAPDAQPVLSLKSPITTINSEKFSDKWTIQWDDTNIDASAVIKFLGGAFSIPENSNAKIAGKRGISIKAEMSNVKELLIFDSDRKTIEDTFQQHVGEIQPDYLYYWIKDALLPENVHYTVTPTGSNELDLPLKPGIASVSLSLKSQHTESLDIVSSGVINCVQLEKLKINKTAQFIGPPVIEITPQQVVPPDEVPLGRLQVH